MAPVIVLLGPTGAGKSVQGRILAEREGWEYISTGDLLRAQKDARIEAMLNRGQLAPSEIVQSLLEKAVSHVDAAVGVVIDGFPRMDEERVWLDHALQKSGRQVSCVLLINVSREESWKRLSIRHRQDDVKTAIERKWDDYHEVMRPVVDEYQRHNLVSEINGEGSPNEVADRVQEALQNAQLI